MHLINVPCVVNRDSKQYPVQNQLDIQLGMFTSTAVSVNEFLSSRLGCQTLALWFFPLTGKGGSKVNRLITFNNQPVAAAARMTDMFWFIPTLSVRRKKKHGRPMTE